MAFVAEERGNATAPPLRSTLWKEWSASVESLSLQKKSKAQRTLCAVRVKKGFGSRVQHILLCSRSTIVFTSKQK